MEKRGIWIPGIKGKVAGLIISMVLALGTAVAARYIIEWLEGRRA